ncbi:MAG: hypothetical protein ABSA83_19600 [Verrucomicrobiota bacterium]
MNVTAQQTEFLSWKLVPARLDATQAAWFLSFEPHEIPRLVTAGFLKPLGHPARNSTKFFATETLEQYRRDEKWLARASDAIAGYWRERNARKAANGEDYLHKPQSLRLRKFHGRFFKSRQTGISTFQLRY